MQLVKYIHVELTPVTFVFRVPKTLEDLPFKYSMKELNTKEIVKTITFEVNLHTIWTRLSSSLSVFSLSVLLINHPIQLIHPPVQSPNSPTHSKITPIHQLIHSNAQFTHPFKNHPIHLLIPSNAQFTHLVNLWSIPNILTFPDQICFQKVKFLEFLGVKLIVKGSVKKCAATWCPMCPLTGKQSITLKLIATKEIKEELYIQVTLSQFLLLGFEHHAINYMQFWRY